MLHQIFMNRIFPGKPTTIDDIITSLFANGLISQTELENIAIARIR